MRITRGTYADFMTTAAAPSNLSLNPAAAGRSRQPPVSLSFRCPLEVPLPPEGHGSCVHQVPELPSPTVPLPPEERSAASPLIPFPGNSHPSPVRPELTSPVLTFRFSVLLSQYIYVTCYFPPRAPLRIRSSGRILPCTFPTVPSLPRFSPLDYAFLPSGRNTLPRQPSPLRPFLPSIHPPIRPERAAPYGA